MRILWDLKYNERSVLLIGIEASNGKKSRTYTVPSNENTMRLEN